jgi:peptidyl-tRNA hydrolase, PTH1 family
MNAKLDSLLCTKDKITFLKPQTFMNDSGTAVSKFLNFYKLNPGVVTVIHDDVDLPFGKIKKQYGPGSAGHRGVEDIIEKLGTQEFWRIRIGVGRSTHANIDTPDWVLASFTDSELSELKNIAEQVEKLVF